MMTPWRMAGFGHQVRSDLGRRRLVADQGRWSQLTLETRTVRRPQSRHGAKCPPHCETAPSDGTTRFDTGADSVPSADLVRVRDSRLVDRQSGERQRCAEFRLSFRFRAAISDISPQTQSSCTAAPLQFRDAETDFITTSKITTVLQSHQLQEDANC